MAVYFGNIGPATGTTVTITGIPFEPVAVIFFGVHNALTNISQTFGVATASDEWALWGGIRQETSGYTGRNRELRDDCCINLYSLTNHSTLQCRGSMSSLNSDGFSVAFTGAGGTNQPVFYAAIGGRNISDAHAGTFTTPASTTGVTSVTGVGFTPKALIVAHFLAGTLNTQTSHMCWGLGFTDGTNQHSNFAAAPAGGGTAAEHIQRTDAIACGAFAFAGLGTYVAAFDSFNSDGFDVDVTDSWGFDLEHGYLAIDCAAAKVDTDEFPDSTGVVSYGTSGFKPGGVLFSWNGADTPSTSGSTTGPVRPGVGAMDGETLASTKAEHGAIMGLHRASAPFGSYQPLQSWRDVGALHIVGSGSQVDPTSTTLFSEGEFNAWVQGSFELDWTTASSNSREFGWLALPGDLPVDWIPSIYRRVM